jgi:hypothetical protein
MFLARTGIFNFAGNREVTCYNTFQISARVMTDDSIIFVLQFFAARSKMK